MTPEHAIQNRIRNALAGVAAVFRCNVGHGWQGNATTLPDKSVLIREPRRFTTGWPPGTSDLIGWQSVTITPEMVGQRVARFVAVECKSGTGRLTEEQARFIAAVQSAGGIAGVARCEADALALLTQPPASAAPR